MQPPHEPAECGRADAGAGGGGDQGSHTPTRSVVSPAAPVRSSPVPEKFSVMSDRSHRVDICVDGNVRRGDLECSNLELAQVRAGFRNKWAGAARIPERYRPELSAEVLSLIRARSLFLAKRELGVPRPLPMAPTRQGPFRVSGPGNLRCRKTSRQVGGHISGNVSSNPRHQRRSTRRVEKCGRVVEIEPQTSSQEA